MKERIIEVLKDKYDALDIIKINDLLSLTTAGELKKLQDEIIELMNDNIIFKTKKDKYILYANCPNLKVGVLTINKAGNGYLLLPEGDLYINYNNLNKATNGDEILAETFLYNNRLEGKVIRILKRNTKNLVGMVYYKNGVPYLLLDDKKKAITIELDPNTTNNCVEGTKVLVNTVKELPNNRYIGRVVQVIGHINDPGVDIKSIAYKYNIFDEFSKEAEAESLKIPVMVSNKDLSGRRDLTKEEIFTIDGDDTKDIDDAISIKYDGKIYILGVHIADVSYYIAKDSALDKDAYERGTSSYLADSVIPMFPHKLSNGICSLNPGVVRLTLSCVMNIDQKGKVIDYDIFPSYIKSRKQMTYQCVNDIIMRDKVAEGYEEYVDSLKTMNELAKILRGEKVFRGYIDFDLDEPKLIVDENGKCIDVQRRLREDGEMLIEDFMIAANETVASHIFNMELPFIYRIHAEPKAEKIADFIHLISLMGYQVVGKFNELNSRSLQELLGQVTDKPEFEVLSGILLRSMQKAIYSPDNIGHFGLGSQCYTHFTSPIRRYPDLMVHRLLREYLVAAKIDNKTINYWTSTLPEIANQCSLREQAAVEAEREVDDMKMAEYMEDHLGEEFSGIISTVTNFGFFVELDNLIEGLVHVNSLTDDYYTHVPELMSLVGNATKKTYRLGDRVHVKVVGASKEERTIDFVVLDGEENGNKQ